MKKLLSIFVAIFYFLACGTGAWAQTNASLSTLLGAGGACYPLDSSTAPQWNNIVGLWHLDETSGTVYYDSSSGVDLTINNTAPYTTGRVGNAFNVNGNYDVYSVSSTGNYADNASKGTIGSSVSWTVAFWIYPTQTPKTAFGNLSDVFALTLNNSCRPCFEYDSYSANGPVAFFFRQSGGCWIVVCGKYDFGQFKANQWQFVAATYDGTTMYTYYNGVLDVSAVLNQASNWVPTETTIGGWAGNWGGYPYGARFPGYIDEVAVWKTALTAAQIRQVYDQQSCGKN